jgi:hypothetical protein
MARLDPAAVHFRKDGARNLDTLMFVSCVFDHDGLWMSGERKNVALAVPDEKLRDLIAFPGLMVRSVFELPPGSCTVRAVVTDTENRHLGQSHARSWCRNCGERGSNAGPRPQALEAQRRSRSGSILARTEESAAANLRGRRVDLCLQYFLNTPITRPCTSTEAAGTMIGFMFTFEGCRRMFSPSR